MENSPISLKPSFSVWREAAIFAARAHEGDRSPKLEAPYIAHPARMALTVAVDFACDDPNVLAATWLHDVLEKTPTSYNEVLEKFGGEIAHWVLLLSKEPGEPKDSYWKELERAPWQVKMIKIADVLDHLCSPLTDVQNCMDAVKRAIALGGGEEKLRTARDRLTNVSSSLGLDASKEQPSPPQSGLQF